MFYALMLRKGSFSTGPLKRRSRGVNPRLQDRARLAKVLRTLPQPRPPAAHMYRPEGCNARIVQAPRVASWGANTRFDLLVM